MKQIYKTTAIIAIMMALLGTSTAIGKLNQNPDQTNVVYDYPDGEIETYSNSNDLFIYVSGLNDRYSSDYIYWNYGYKVNIPIYIEIRNQQMLNVRSNISVRIDGITPNDEKYNLFYRYKTDISSIKYGFTIPYDNLGKFDWLVLRIKAQKYGSSRWTIFEKYIDIKPH